jgi:deoxyhypusine synthase
MRDTTTQVVLGTFVSTFVYCLLVLRTIRRADEIAFVPHLSVNIGVLFALVSVGVLIYFIHHVSTSMQADQVVARVGKELAEEIHRLFPERLGQEQGQPAIESTDTSIPETVMRHLEKRLLKVWGAASAAGVRKMQSEYLFEILGDPTLPQHYQIPESDSWMLAAREKGIPVYSPGWEDSTTGNMFTAACWRGELPNHLCVKTGTEQLQHLMHWYLDNCNRGTDKPSVGFFQIGGGIAGDFAICAVPAMIQDLEIEDCPFWGYFAQISDAVTSYGGYSGAVPNEKITWGKLAVSTPKFMIQSDATIVAPLIFGFILGD